MIATKNATSKVVIPFLEEYILIQFGTPFSIMCDNGPRFNSTKLSNWDKSHNIFLSLSANYYP